MSWCWSRGSWEVWASLLMCFNRAGQCQTTPQKVSPGWGQPLAAQPALAAAPAHGQLQTCSLLALWEMLFEGRRGEVSGGCPGRDGAHGMLAKPSHSAGQHNSLWALLTLPSTTRAWLGCSWAVPVMPSPTGQWETEHIPKSRRKPHAWRYPSPFIHLHSLPCTLNDFSAFILCCTSQWLRLSDAFSDKTLVFQLLLPKFHYRGLNFPSKHLLQSQSWGENTWNKSGVLQNELMENRVVLSTFAKKKKKRIINVSQSNTNIFHTIEWNIEACWRREEIASSKPWEGNHHCWGGWAMARTFPPWLQMGICHGQGHAWDKPSTPPKAAGAVSRPWLDGAIALKIFQPCLGAILCPVLWDNSAWADRLALMTHCGPFQAGPFWGSVSTCASERVSHGCLAWACGFLEDKCSIVLSGEHCWGIFQLLQDAAVITSFINLW